MSIGWTDRPQPRVNRAFAGRQAGNAHFTRGSGQVLRRGYGYSVIELRFVATLQNAPPILCGGGDSAGDASFLRAAGGQVAAGSKSEGVSEG